MAKVKYYAKENSTIGIIKNRKANAHKFFDIEDKTTAYMMYPTHKR